MSKRRNLLFGAAVSFMSLAIASRGLAQQAGDDVLQTPEQTAPEAAEEDMIVVTGSRLRRTESQLTGTNVSVSSEQIELRQFTNIVSALEELPLVGAGTNSAGANGQLGDNFAFTDFLDCGTNRTLTLVNGRRFVGASQGTVFVPDNATGAQVDLTAINPGFVERLETETGKGGAIYGADAVCGVVNIITRQDFEGARFTAQGGFTEFLDGGNWSANGVYGKNFLNGRANVMVGLNYLHQDLIGSGGPRGFDQGQGFQVNPLNGGTRDPAPFSALSAAQTLQFGGSLNPAFLPSGSDGLVPDMFSPRPLTSGFSTTFGVLAGSPNSLGGATPGGANTPFFPSTPIPGALAGRAADPQGFAFFAPSSLPPGVSAASVISTLAPDVNLSSLTSTQQNTLAVNLLQRNRPTPFEFAQANPNLDPNLFLALFQPTTTTALAGIFGAGNTGSVFPTIANTNPATNTLFPRVAVPLQFDAAGNLVPFSFGDTSASAFPTIGTTVGGDGVFGDQLRLGNLLSETDRGTFNMQTRYDITNNIRFRTEALYTDIRFRSNAGAIGNSAFGSPVAGSLAVPVFINDNPFLTEQALGVINDLRLGPDGLVDGAQAVDANGAPLVNAQGAPILNPRDGAAFATINGREALFVNRTFTDLRFGSGTAPLVNGNDVRAWRLAGILDGDFNFLNRDFYWETSFVYGRNRSNNLQTDALDVPFAIAVDAVRDPNTGAIVCQQQTLAAPVDVSVNNPTLTSSAIGPGGNSVPTAADVAACVPLNVIGANSAETIAAASANIISSAGSRNVNQQFYAAGTFGGELVRLPGGAATFNAQFEWRRETLNFDAGAVFGTGAIRATTGQSASGSLSFFEGGFEANAPIFGDDFRLPGFYALEFDGAVRVVRRSGNPGTAGFENIDPAGVRDVTFQAGGRWAPIQDVVFSGYRSRAVRSPSIIELFGAIGTGFSNGEELPCEISNGEPSQGPNPDQRLANCLFAVQQVVPGITSDQQALAFLSTYSEIGGGTLASTGGNPFLQNEFADNWQVSVNIRPRFIPGLTLASTYLAVSLSNQISLFGGAGAANACFDNSDFAAGNFAPICANTVLAVDNGSGTFVVPNSNPLTGAPLPPAAVAGTTISQQAPFNVAFSFFGNTNISTLDIRAVNSEIRYNFEIADLLGAFAADWGSLALRGSAYWLRRYDTFLDGTQNTFNPAAGEIPTLETRVDITHRIGKLTHQLQWIRDNSTVGDVLTPREDLDEQSLVFFQPGDSIINYNAQYQINDNFGVGFAANNLTRTSPFPQFDIIQGGIGRSFSLSFFGRF